MWHPDELLSSQARRCQFVHSESGLDILLYSVPDPAQCNRTSAASYPGNPPSLARYRVDSMSLADSQIYIERRSGYLTSGLISPIAQLCLDSSVAGLEEADCLCHDSAGLPSGDATADLIVTISSGQIRSLSANATGSGPGLTTASRQWQLPLLKHFAWALTSSGELFMDGGMTRLQLAERSYSDYGDASSSFLLGLDATWVKHLRGGGAAYAWAQGSADPESTAIPLIFSSPDQTASQASSTILLVGENDPHHR